MPEQLALTPEPPARDVLKTRLIWLAVAMSAEELRELVDLAEAIERRRAAVDPRTPGAGL